jgi:hypothetical protein
MIPAVMDVTDFRHCTVRARNVDKQISRHIRHHMRMSSP